MMQAGAIARFGGITAYGDKFRGTEFHFVDLDGWTDAPGIMMSEVKRPADHGSFVVPAFLRPRTVRLRGFYVGNNHYELEHASSNFRSLIAQHLMLSIEDVNETNRAKGTVAEASFTNYGFAPEGQWTLVLECEDPRIYGKTNEYAGSAPAVQWGTFPAWPTFVVTGSSPGGYTITGPGGKRIVVTTALVAGIPHTIDVSEGEVTIGGSLGNISVFEPWTIGPGLPAVTHTISAGALLTRVTDTHA